MDKKRELAQKMGIPGIDKYITQIKGSKFKLKAIPNDSSITVEIHNIETDETIALKNLIDKDIDSLWCFMRSIRVLCNA